MSRLGITLAMDLHPARITISVDYRSTWKKHASPLRKRTSRPCAERGGKPWRKVSGKSTGSIKLYSSPLLRCIKVLQVSASKKRSEPRISSVPCRTEKTASVPATVYMQLSRDSVFHLFSSRKASAGEICLMMAALHWELDTQSVPLSRPYTCRM